MIYEIVKYSPDLSGEVARLQRLLWSSDAATNLRYLEWKYHQNPYVQPPLIYLARAAGQVVGMRGFMGSRWRVGSETVMLPIAGDLVIEPAHRDRGALSLLMGAALEDLAEQGYPYVINLSAQTVTLIASLAAGWRSVGSPGILSRAAGAAGAVRSLLPKVGPLRPINQKLAKLGRLLGAPSLRRPFARLDRTARRRPHSRISLKDAPRPGEMAELAGRSPDPRSIRHVRDEAFFAWRFRNPRAAYRFLFWEDDSLRGYLVLAVGLAYEADHFYPKVRLVDCEATDADIESELLEAAMTWGRFGLIETWAAGLSAHAMASLERRGFRLANPPPSMRDPGVNLLVRPTRSSTAAADWVLGGASLLDLDNWDLRPACSDHN
jgi:GNAT superfamily N-acetyltransferase